MTTVHIHEERTAELGGAIGRLEAPAVALARDIGSLVDQLAALGVNTVHDPAKTLRDVGAEAPGISAEISVRLAYLAACRQVESSLGIDISDQISFENLPTPNVAAVTRALQSALRAADGAGIRASLSGLTGSEVQLALESHPALIAELQGELPPRLPWYSVPLLTEPGAEVVPEDLVRAHMAHLDPEDRRKLVLLYPDLANIDGVPPPDRFAGNRLNIAAALDRETAAEDGSQERITFYRSLLEETPQMVALNGLPVESDGHQVLLFDPERSRFAEVFGELPTAGSDTSGVDVGILIPGAGTNMDTIAGTSARALSLHDAVVPPGSSPTIAWLGGDMPQGVQAAHTKFADDLGPRLPALLRGLDLPDSAGTVAFGHSYGGSVLGTALREGLDVDSAVFVNAAGLGPGVSGIEDYPAAATTDFYNVSVPGDWINWTQDLVHGADPDRAEGMIQVDTGWYDEAGSITLADSPDTHSGIFDTRTTAFANMAAILQGDGARITVEGTHRAWHGGPLETPIDHPEYREELLTVE
jgi:hypothetical protein